MQVRRLKDAGSGPYVIEVRDGLTSEQSDLLAARWWTYAKHTVMIAYVDHEGKSSVPYVRTTFDQSRVPEDWVAWKAPPAPAPLESASTERPVVDLCDNDDPPDTPRPSRDLDTPQRCGCCGGDRRHHGETDKSPSGRLADQRCPACGAPLPGSKRDIYRMYLQYSRGL